MKKNTKKIVYSEPADYFPKDVRKMIDKELAKQKKNNTSKTVKRTTKKK